LSGAPCPGQAILAPLQAFFSERGIIGSARTRPDFVACLKGKGIETDKRAIGIAPGAIFL